MKGKVGWIDRGRFLAESGTGHSLPMHARILGDEVTTAPSPMEWVLRSDRAAHQSRAERPQTRCQPAEGQLHSVVS